MPFADGRIYDEGYGKIPSDRRPVSDRFSGCYDRRDRPDIHSGAKAKMDAVGIPYEKRHARQVTLSDYEYYDYIIAMDDENVRDMERIFGPDTAHKIHKLLEFAGQSRNVADPWYTGDFDTTYDDLLLGISSLLKSLKEERKAG